MRRSASATSVPASQTSAISHTPDSDAERVERFDPRFIETLRGLRVADEPDPVAELVDLFIRDTPPRIDEAAIAIRGHDPSALKAAAHTLKGSSNNLGGRRLSLLAGKLENAAKIENWAEAELLLPKTANELKAFCEVLEEEKKR
jgi:HPt (histidine-containing phosphotransfer) domain-containing protein